MGTPYRRNLSCPRCRGSLSETRLSHTALQLCGACGGVWLDHRSTAAMVEAREADAIAVVEKLTGEAETKTDTSAAGIPCPECGCRLAVKRFFPGNVTVDVCRDHGIWFDAQELGRMARAAEHHRRSKARRDSSPKPRDAAGEPSQGRSPTVDSGAARAAEFAGGIQWLFRGAADLLKKANAREDSLEDSGHDETGLGDWSPIRRRPDR